MRVHRFLHFGCKGSFSAVGHEERGHGNVLCAIESPELCASGQASLGIADVTRVSWEPSKGVKG